MRGFKQFQMVGKIDIIMISSSNSKEVISFWVGATSQLMAFSFYNLQADQIFSEQDDPLDQRAIWSDISKASPRMLIYDTQIDRLAQVRKANNRKTIEKIKNTGGSEFMGGIYGNIDFRGLQQESQSKPQEQQEEDPRWAEFANWTDSPKNYLKLQTDYSQTNQHISTDIEQAQFEIHSQFYRQNQEESQDRIRKQMEQCDYLKCLTLCSDSVNCGFTSKLIEYLREECPKKSYLLTTISTAKQEVFSPLLVSKMYDEVDVFVPISGSAAKYEFFQGASLTQELAPYFCSLYAPFLMKDVNPATYIDTIVTDNRRIFNSAYTLPIIDKDLSLQTCSNIFRYEETFKPESQRKEEDKQRKGKSKKTEEQTPEELRVNLTNSSYLAPTRGRYISESYILKGHFKDFQKTFQPKSEPSALSIKYLEGIFSVPENIKIKYHPFYNHWYEQETVESYPYHMVLFSHEGFGDRIRAETKLMKKPKVYSQYWQQNMQKALAIADNYQEMVHSDSD